MRVKFLIFILLFLVHSNTHAQQMVWHSLDSFYCKFSYPSNFAIEISTDTSFIARNDSIDLFVFPKTEVFFTPIQMQEKLINLAKINKLENTSEVKLLDSQAINGLFGYAIEGRKNDKLYDILILQNLNFQEKNIYVAIKYPDDYADLAIEIMTSFAPLEVKDKDMQKSQILDKEQTNYCYLMDEKGDSLVLIVNGTVDYSVFSEAILFSAGGIFQNYDLCNSYAAISAIKESCLSKNITTEVILSKLIENYWPEAIETKLGHANNIDVFFNRLKCFELAQFEDKIIVVAPKDLNTDLEIPGISIDHDFFIVVSMNSVILSREEE